MVLQKKELFAIFLKATHCVTPSRVCPGGSWRKTTMMPAFKPTKSGLTEEPTNLSKMSVSSNCPSILSTSQPHIASLKCVLGASTVTDISDENPPPRWNKLYFLELFSVFVVYVS